MQNKVHFQNTRIQNPRTWIANSSYSPQFAWHLNTISRSWSDPWPSMSPLSSAVPVHPLLIFIISTTSRQNRRIGSLTPAHTYTTWTHGFIMQLLMRCSVHSEGGESTGINDWGEGRQLEKEGGYSWSKRGIKSSPLAEGTQDRKGIREQNRNLTPAAHTAANFEVSSLSDVFVPLAFLCPPSHLSFFTPVLLPDKLGV